jgi:hypothetical protein
MLSNTNLLAEASPPLSVDMRAHLLLLLLLLMQEAMTAKKQWARYSSIDLSSLENERPS